MDSKKTLLQVGTIISIVAVAIINFIIIVGLPSIRPQVQRVVQEQGLYLSVEQIDSVVALIQMSFIVCMLIGFAAIVIAIILEVKIFKNKKTKGLSIALVIINIVYAIAVGLSASNLIIGMMMVAVAVILLLLGLCLKPENNQARANPYIDNNNNTLL